MLAIASTVREPPRNRHFAFPCTEAGIFSLSLSDFVLICLSLSERVYFKGLTNMLRIRDRRFHPFQYAKIAIHRARVVRRNPAGRRQNGLRGSFANPDRRHSTDPRRQ